MLNSVTTWRDWLVSHAAFLVVPMLWNVPYAYSSFASTVANFINSRFQTTSLTSWTSLAHDFRHSLRELQSSFAPDGAILVIARGDAGSFMKTTLHSIFTGFQGWPGNKDHRKRLSLAVIRRVQCSHERILIEVSDHVPVTRVEVTILDETGNIAEQGEALRGHSNRWEYIPRTLGMMVTVRAWDLRGNVSRFVAV